MQAPTPAPAPAPAPARQPDGRGRAQAYPPLVVIGTILGKFFDYRGLALAPSGLGAGVPPTFNDDRIIGDMDRNGYVRLDAVCRPPRGRRDWVVILVLSSRGKYAHHSPDLRKLLEGVETEKPAKEGRLSDLLLVAEEEFFGKKNLTDLVEELQRRETQTRAARSPLLPEAERRRLAYGDGDGVAPYYSAHPYHNFVLAVPEHVAVPAHVLMSADEVESLLRVFRLDRSSLPIIRSTDPPIVWLGARDGQTVLIIRDSQTAGIALYFRRVERASIAA